MKLVTTNRQANAADRMVEKRAVPARVKVAKFAPSAADLAFRLYADASVV